MNARGALVFIERARLAAELAERAWHPADPLPAGTGLAVACDLYRQSIHWSLLAHRALGRDGAEASEPLSTLFGEIDPALLARSAGGADVAMLRSELLERSFVDFAELSDARQGELAGMARDFSRGLLEALEPERKKAERAWVRRIVLVASALVGLVVVVLSWRAISAALEARRDLAAGARWTTSSRFEVGGCRSPAQDCAESPDYFFHTLPENDPWVTFDLGKARRMSAVVVRNRVDCCPERAAPLLVELSTDGKNWTTVATQPSPFDIWRASFPSARARYVKLRVAKPGAILHLKSVRVLPG